MARDGFTALLCALVLSSPFLAAADDGPDAAIATALAVQRALNQGREQIERGQYGAAVHTLESQLPRINGNRQYLSSLRDAYRGYVKELRLAGREPEAQTYLRRLEILDPEARASLDAVRPAEARSPAADSARPPLTNAELAAGSGTTTGPKVRGIRQDDRATSKDDPFHPSNRLEGRPPTSLLAQAQQEWQAKRYETALRYYEQAHQADPRSTDPYRDQWAYCKLYAVMRHLNQPSAGSPSLPQLEQEVRAALALSSRLESEGKYILDRLQERRATGRGAEPAVTVNHQPRGSDGWAIATTSNFRILHNQDRDFVEQVARVAERTRADVSRVWFGDDGGTWGTRCDLYLHATAPEYSRATGKPTSWPAHSTISQDGSRVLSRRIDLHCDDRNLLTSTLPHEATHTVLAGRFGGPDLPRWVDEGIAILNEPRDKIDGHLRTLSRHHQDGLLFGLAELMRLDNYPEPRRVGAFYAQSVSLTQYLVSLQGPQTFTSFVSQAMRYGTDKALQRHYGFDLTELERRWQRSAFGGETAKAAGGLDAGMRTER